jgi:hypothetical protein
MEPEYRDLPDPQRDPAQFVLDAFVRRLEGQGGRELPERCQPRILSDMGDGVTRHTTGCGGQTRFEAPYECEDGQMRTVRACAVDDGALVWPRFKQDAIEGGWRSDA